MSNTTTVIMLYTTTRYHSTGVDDTEQNVVAASRPSSTGTLWFGDIPADLATAKRLSEILYLHRPATMPTPSVAKVVRQGYRGGASHPMAQGGRADAGDALQSHAVEGSAEQGVGAGRALSPWLGYAFVVFRDHQEAEEGLRVFDGLRVCGGALRVQWADERHQNQGPKGRRHAPRLGPGCDPPLGEQLFPPTFYGQDLLLEVERRRQAAGLMLSPGTDTWVAVEVIKAFYMSRPRREVAAAGSPVPAGLLGPLLTELRQTRWPAIHHRPGVQAEQYLVLRRGHEAQQNEGYADLLGLLEGLLEWVDPSFGCNLIAVTKDFQGLATI